MARRFFYISLGILCLAIAYNLGAKSARADWDHGGLGCIAGADGNLFWTRSGEAYILNDIFWGRRPDLDLPVPASDMKLIGTSGGGSSAIVTNDDVVYVLLADEHWHPAEPFPGCGGTSVEKDSWGGVKQRFRH